MSRSNLHQQGKTTPSPRRTRSGRARDPTPESESDSESPERYRMQNTSGYNRKPVAASKKSYHDYYDASDPQSASVKRSPGGSPESTKSTPWRHQSLYPDTDINKYADSEPSPKSGQSSRSFTSSPGSKSPPSEQSIYPDLRKRFSDDDSNGSYDETDIKHSPTAYNQQYGKIYQHDQFGKKKHKNPSTFHDVVDKSRSVSKEYYKEPRRPSKQEDFDDEANNGSFLYIVGGLFIVVMMIAITLCNLPSSGPVEEKQPKSRYDLFSTDIQELQHYFPNQKTRLWRSVIASSRHVLKEPNSTYPSVILLASQVESPHLSSCIAEKIASSFVKSHGVNPGKVPTTDIEAIKDFAPSEQKLKLDKDIQTALQKPHGKAYIIQNLQTLSPQAALLLHGLCDGDNAPYKDVMILMTLELKQTTPAMTASEIENRLTQLWTTPEVEYDKVSAVMSRISNNLVVIQHENPAHVEKLCPVY